MHGKKFVISLLTTYFTVVTLVTVAMLVLGLWLEPQATFGYEAFAVPLLYGFFGLIPMGIMYSTRELTVKEIIVRKVIQFVVIEALILWEAFGGAELTEEKVKAMVSVGISVFVIYVLAHVVDWIQNCVSAKKMTQDLMRLQEKFR